MKRQFLLPRMIAALSLVVAPALAQTSNLLAQEAVPAPATSTLVSAEKFPQPTACRRVGDS